MMFLIVKSSHTNGTCRTKVRMKLKFGKLTSSLSAYIVFATVRHRIFLMTLSEPRYIALHLTVRIGFKTDPKSGLSWLTDNNDSTCYTVKSQALIVNLTTSIPITWIRFVIDRPGNEVIV